MSSKEKIQPDEVFDLAVNALKDGMPIEVLRAEIEAAYRLYRKLPAALFDSTANPDLEDIHR